jgi:hypothetical protein
MRSLTPHVFPDMLKVLDRCRVASSSDVEYLRIFGVLQAQRTRLQDDSAF